jgi:hypothetical protein
MTTDQRCLHRRAIVGLDAFYCPSCKQIINAETAAYQDLLHRAVIQTRLIEAMLIEQKQQLPKHQSIQRQHEQNDEQLMLTF